MLFNYLTSCFHTVTRNQSDSRERRDFQAKSDLPDERLQSKRWFSSGTRFANWTLNVLCFNLYSYRRLTLTALASGWRYGCHWWHLWTKWDMTLITVQSSDICDKSDSTFTMCVGHRGDGGMRLPQWKGYDGTGVLGMAFESGCRVENSNWKSA